MITMINIDTHKPIVLKPTIIKGVVTKTAQEKAAAFKKSGKWIVEGEPLPVSEGVAKGVIEASLKNAQKVETDAELKMAAAEEMMRKAQAMLEEAEKNTKKRK